jgi:hypothetical protein
MGLSSAVLPQANPFPLGFLLTHLSGLHYSRLGCRASWIDHRQVYVIWINRRRRRSWGVQVVGR